MADWGTILQVAGQVIKVGGRVAGSIASKRAERRMRHRNANILKNMRNREQSNFENQYYADATATADSQRTLTLMKDYLKERRQQLSGQQGMGMATGEDVAQQKAADNQAVTEAASTIAANAAEKKDNLLASHQASQEGYDATQIGWNQQHNAYRQQKIAAGVKAASDAGDAVTKMGSALGGSYTFLDTSSKSKS